MRLSTGIVLIGVQKLIAETVAEERTGAAQGIAFFANGFSHGGRDACCPVRSTTAFGADGFFAMVGDCARPGWRWSQLCGARSAPERRLGR